MFEFQTTSKANRTPIVIYSARHDDLIMPFLALVGMQVIVESLMLENNFITMSTNGS
jgi:hypothetical protein